MKTALCRLAARLVPAVLLALASGSVPAFQMNTIDGQRVPLEAQLGGGRWTLVQFWSLDCRACERQKPMLEAFHQAHRQTDARVIGVVLDGPAQIDAIRAHLARGQSSYTQLVAFPDVFPRQFREATDQPFRATPTYWLFDPQGRPVGLHVGPVTRDDLEAIVAAPR